MFTDWCPMKSFLPYDRVTRIELEGQAGVLRDV